MTSMDLNDSWGSPFLTPPAPAPPPSPPPEVPKLIKMEEDDEETPVVSSRTATEDKVANIVPDETLASLLDEMRQLRKESRQQGFALLFVMALQSYFLFTYLNKAHAHARRQ